MKKTIAQLMVKAEATTTRKKALKVLKKVGKLLNTSSKE